jgi:hypothetical protein
MTNHAPGHVAKVVEPRFEKTSFFPFFDVNVPMPAGTPAPRKAPSNGQEPASNVAQPPLPPNQTHAR